MKKRNIHCVTVIVMMLLTVSSYSQTKDNYYVKTVSFPAGLSIDVKVDMASRLIPTDQQLEWQRMELTAFLHFGINTFTGREWGDGHESPQLFNPLKFDADQWVRTLKENGFKLALITAKHHDGFCLWPTKTTKHSVENSPWQNGKGDVVRELKNACDKYGIRFGVYLSPWDRNASCYGTQEYNHFFVEQLTELLTNYGEVYEVWFDGANGEGPNGKKQEYDWELILSTIRRLQPKAVTAIMGDDVRWVGNESGLGRETEWSPTVLTPACYTRSSAQNDELGISATSKDLGSRQMLAKVSEVFWHPSEVDVSIRPGWFYHKEEDRKVRSLENLVDIYFKSVGCNSVLLLNIPPDKDGLISWYDVSRLNELSEYLKKVFDNNLVKNGNKYLKIEQGKSVKYSLKQNSVINTILLQEDITKGQHVEKFYIEAYKDGSWKKITEGTTIGYKRLLRIPECMTSRLRLTIEQSRGNAYILNFGSFYAPSLKKEQRRGILNEVETTGWKIVSPKDAKKSIYEGTEIADWKSSDLSPLIIDLGRSIEISGFTYTPIANENKAGTIFHYNIYVSNDGINWEKKNESSEFSNIKNNPITQYVNLKQKQETRFVKFEVISTINNEPYYSIGKFGILEK